MARSPSRKLVVIGCGNINRSDDGVGVVVAHRLKAWLDGAGLEGVGVFDAGTGGMDVIFQARGATSLIIVDACRTGSKAGSIYKVPGDEVTRQPVYGYSLHDFRWDHALYAGRKMFGSSFPEHVTVFLVEAADLSYGVELTATVSTAVSTVVAEIKDEICQWAHEAN